jgi:hypothetical protein
MQPAVQRPGEIALAKANFPWPAIRRTDGTIPGAAADTLPRGIDGRPRTTPQAELGRAEPDRGAQSRDYTEFLRGNLRLDQAVNQN